MRIEYLTLQQVEIKILLTTSKRKSIKIKPKPQNTLEINTPPFTPLNSIIKLIKSKEKWITKCLKELNKGENSFIYTEGGYINHINGKLYIKKASIKNPVVENNFILIPSTKDIKSTIEKWLREEARTYITPLVFNYSNLLGVDFNRITIKNQKTRWGSCSSKGNLNFNWKIILTTPGLLKYLVIHEVCHLIEMNHSRDFWNLVGKLDPDYRVNRAELKKYSYLLAY